MKKLKPKQIRQGYDQGFVEGYNKAVDDRELEIKKEKDKARKK